MTSSPTAVSSGRARNESVIFSVGFALAAMFHVLGNPRLAPSSSVAVLGFAAGWVLLMPRSGPARSALAVSILGTAWLEAPTLGNHWLLASLVALAWLVAALAGALRGQSDDEIWFRFARTARVTLLVAYSFAAFAKLNADFFDPVVSCAGFYLRESAGSIGLDALADSPIGWIDRVAMFGTAGIELAIPVLLVVRRSRPFGVVLAIGFHYVLAIDRTHQFFDFSSLLTVLFLLFASTEVQRGLVEAVGTLVRRLSSLWTSLPELLHLLGAVAVVAAGRRVPRRRSGDILAPRCRGVGGRGSRDVAYAGALRRAGLASSGGRRALAPARARLPQRADPVHRGQDRLRLEHVQQSADRRR
jgi:hypothetical protein